ncbi:hypothetical protein CH379_016785 [Leptospira ellisii]|uniref:Uncharacterized protein n=1 Tax=Leptospira ellisii TaxID=2023197 RepID=A0A2N0BNJ9_9LEPT|nr:hypothetical protein [Leptospira ellisii]MDV6237291.1 hypothetical protein [Leptospira ellisii]PJZ92418.1 hypothetical protein CH379_13285 [Leptospira ellisii]PKA05549.1 hypothetical protein CH375_04590 [Leptospira ellisii]
MKYLVLIIFCFSIIFCQEEKGRYEKDEFNRLLANAFVQTRSDCVYCTDTQAFQGNCTCFTQIPVWSCQGYSSGRQKSNSVKISCEDLTSKGIWTEDPENTGVKSCTYLTCPPEAYRAAFTPDGL